MLRGMFTIVGVGTGEQQHIKKIPDKQKNGCTTILNARYHIARFLSIPQVQLKALLQHRNSSKKARTELSRYCLEAS